LEVNSSIETMAKKLALTRRSEYLAVYESGKAYAGHVLVIKMLPNSLKTTRVGFSVTKEIGGAVVRNRVKRLLKEIARAVNIKPGWDIVFIARRKIVDADFHQLNKAVMDLLRRADLLEQNA